MKGRQVFVVGVGMTKFEKPGRREDFDYPVMAKESVTKAAIDAGLKFDDVEYAAVGYCFGDSTCGQRALYELGMKQIPIVNVNNNCSTGSTALYLSRQAIAGGLVDCALAVGFEKMAPGSLGSVFDDRTNPMDKHFENMVDNRGFNPKSPPTSQIFGNAGLEHMEKYGTKDIHFAKIAEKNHRHSVLNPYSQFRDQYSLEQITKSPHVFEFMTRLHCCPTSDGSGAVILASKDFVTKHKLEGQAIEIVAQELVTDSPKAFNGSSIELAGADMTRVASERAFKDASMRPSDVQVVELHDCFSANELITYEALGLCGVGKAGEFIDSGNNTFGGKFVVNPSGGLISKGHPLGATGLAQCCELTWQLRGHCGERQVPNCKAALQHNLGLGGAAVVTIYKKAFDVKPLDPVSRHGYNPAVEARIPTEADFKRVCSEIVGQNEQDQSSAVPAASVESGSSVAVDGFKCSEMFEQVNMKFKAMDAAEKSSLNKKIGGVMQFDVKNNLGATQTWSMDIKTSQGPSIMVGSVSGLKPDVTISVADQDLMDLFQGKINGQKAFMSGKLKVKGKMMLATKLDQVLKPGSSAESKL